MSETITLRGEMVEILGPKPDDWTGLGRTYDDAILVCYPDGEVGAVPREQIEEARKRAN
jgi:hypothetical protein